MCGNTFLWSCALCNLHPRNLTLFHSCLTFQSHCFFLLCFKQEMIIFLEVVRTQFSECCRYLPKSYALNYHCCAILRSVLLSYFSHSVPISDFHLHPESYTYIAPRESFCCQSIIVVKLFHNSYKISVAYNNRIYT